MVETSESHSGHGLHRYAYLDHHLLHTFPIRSAKAFRWNVIKTNSRGLYNLPQIFAQLPRCGHRISNHDACRIAYHRCCRRNSAHPVVTIRKESTMSTSKSKCARDRERDLSEQQDTSKSRPSRITEVPNTTTLYQLKPHRHRRHCCLQGRISGYSKQPPLYWQPTTITIPSRHAYPIIGGEEI